MAVPEEVTQLVSFIGLPLGTMGAAYGLVRGAAELEKDASTQALRMVSSLIKSGRLRDVGQLGGRLVPLTFDRIFGTHPLSLKFVTRSVVATTIIWLALLALRHPDWHKATFVDNDIAITLAFIPVAYFVDWLSLIKARFILRYMSLRRANLSMIGFVLIDVSISYFLPAIVWFHYWVIIRGLPNELPQVVAQYFSPYPFTIGYFGNPAVTLGDVIIPSTFLTSMWSILLMLSSAVAILLVPLDYLRSFTAFWFKDVDTKPLSSIAKVAAALIISGACIVKAGHWIYG